jgi:hypothetical protein
VVTFGNIAGNLIYVTTDLGNTALRSNKRAGSEENLEPCVGEYHCRDVPTFNYPAAT